MDDTISRLAVIQIIEKMRARIGHNLERSVGRAMIEILDDVGEDVGKLPSALGANLASLGTDCISRQQAIDALHMDTSIIPFEKAREYADATISEIRNRLEKLPSAQPEIKPIDYQDCANAMLLMWMDEVLTDGEYNRIMDKLNAHWAKGR